MQVGTVLLVVVVLVLAGLVVWRMTRPAGRREGMAAQITDELLAKFREATGQPVTREMLAQAMQDSKMTAEQLLEDARKTPPMGVAAGPDPAPTLADLMACKKAGNFGPVPKDGKCPAGQVVLPAQNGGLCAKNEDCAKKYVETLAYYNGDVNLLLQHVLAM